MLAKRWQRSILVDSLKSTCETEIHEECGDRFWGFGRRQGEDWLGKVLSHIRACLRSPESDGPLSGLVRGRFLNYETAAAVRSIRNGGQPWLVHLIRYRESAKPIDLLRRVMEEGILRASRQLNRYDAVCFSAAPLRDLE